MLYAQESSHVTGKHFNEALHLFKVWSGEGTFLAWCLFRGGGGRAVVLVSYAQNYCPFNVHAASVHPQTGV